ncbi:MAG: glucose-1-phosphate thymidylyltransferase, partial [Bacteroidetes bacterium]|nr:glucose-1-phosphate thymidylyltransferase [Bacteroidota bacterium]
MDKIIFTEEFCQPENLRPFTLTRQIQDIRVGILTIREKWETIFGLPSFDKKENDYKDLDRSVDIEDVIGNNTCFIINGNILPTQKLIKAIRKIKDGEFISVEGHAAIFRVTKKEIKEFHKIKISKAIPVKEPAKIIRYPWDIFQLNDWAIREDFELITQKRKSQPVSKTNRIQNPEQIFIEKGARVEASILNASTGPIYIGRNAEVMEGCMIRGPFALCEKAVLKMGTRIYGATTLGPGSTGGGEIKNSVVFGNSN